MCLVMGAAVACEAHWWKGSKFASISADQFWTRVGRHNYVVLEFFTPWCKFCRKFFPDFNAAAAAFQGPHALRSDIEFYKMNAETSDYLSDFFEATELPAILVFGPYDNRPELYKGGFDQASIIDFLKSLAPMERSKPLKAYFESGHFGKLKYDRFVREQREEEKRSERRRASKRASTHK